jgi:hypothetical protein
MYVHNEFGCAKGMPYALNQKMSLCSSKYGPIPTFQYQRVFTRVILILGVLTVIYFGTKDGREFALAKQKEVIHQRAQDIVCSNDYKAELESFPGLFLNLAC